MRKKESIYIELDPHNPALSREDLIDAMIANPILIERPVFIHNGRDAIGRPPESFRTLWTAE